MNGVSIGDRYILERTAFPRLIDSLTTAGYAVVGPTVRDGAIVYGPIRSESDLPIGWTDRQEAGQYRLVRREDAALFGYNLGPHSWKKYLFPAHERLWTATSSEGGFSVRAEPPDPTRYAFLGVRACEIAALSVTDRVFNGKFPDPGYVARRGNVLQIAVQCGQSGATCFCQSMGTGPGVTGGFDLSMTELLDPAPHRFLIEVGTDAGARVLSGLPLRPAEPAEISAVGGIVQRTTASMGRRMEAKGVRELLLENLEHPRWQNVASRCLSCTNCTMACPTCFCSTTEEVPELSGEKVERWRRWDSCFNLAFSGLHLTSVRKSTASRYRQWLTHKLGSWHDQFGVSGCVGCGRCVTWCPVGIDLTEEVAAIRASPDPAKSSGAPP